MKDILGESSQGSVSEFHYLRKFFDKRYVEEFFRQTNFIEVIKLPADRTCLQILF